MVTQIDKHEDKCPCCDNEIEVILKTRIDSVTKNVTVEYDIFNNE